MSVDAETLYRLLPEFLRARDAHEGQAERARLGLPLPPIDEATGPLFELVDILAGMLDAVDADIDQLYDDQFIETCADWVVPYIGDLVAARALPEGEGAADTARARVADTVATRRRKGTLLALEILGRAATRRPVMAVEYFPRVLVARHLDLPAPLAPQSVDTTDGAALARLDHPDSVVPRSADMRRMIDGGRVNLPNVGVFVWPWQSRRHVGAQPRREGASRRFRFDPLGLDRALVRDVAGLADATRTRTRAADLPEAIDRAAMRREPAAFYGPSLAIRVGGETVPAEEILVCNLADRPDGTWNRRGPARDPAPTKLDPALGRFILGDRFDPADGVRVDYAYAAPAAIGGGAYARAEADLFGDGVRVVDDAATALPAFSAAPVIALATSRTLPLRATIAVPADTDCVLAARSGQWPLLERAGTVEVTGGRDATLTLRGLRIAGGTLVVRQPAGSRGLRAVVLEDCTLVPGLTVGPDGTPGAPAAASLRIEARGCTVALRRCVTGPVELDPDSTIDIEASILDAPDPARPALSGGPDGAGGFLDAGIADIRDSTILGAVRLMAVREVTGLLAADPRGGAPAPLVRVTGVQTGCFRYCALPPGSMVPRPYRCLPWISRGPPPAPWFEATTYGAPGYAALRPETSDAIRLGGEHGREIGAFADAAIGQRLDRLARLLPDFTRFGHDVGLRVERPD